jgi:hypothetical protein
LKQPCRMDAHPDECNLIQNLLAVEFRLWGQSVSV